MEDNWRRSHKNEDRTEDFGEYDYSEESDSLMAAQADSIALADSIAEAQERMADSLASDRTTGNITCNKSHSRKSSCKPPTTSCATRFISRILEMERLENFGLARRTLLRLIETFPDVATKTTCTTIYSLSTAD